MSSKATGARAELAARQYLEMRGFIILEQNWRRPHCEVDLIVRKGSTVQFVEVKYRASDAQGGGFEAITASKLQRMRRAAETWVTETKWQGDYMLSAIELAGADFTVVGFVEDVF